MSRWFRWYEGTTEDGKFRVVARNAGVTVRDAVALWAFMLEDASSDDHRGVCRRNEDFMAAILDFEDGVVESILAAMEAVDMISVGHGAITICHWRERQFETDRVDATNAERQKRWREKQKQTAAAGTAEQPRNGTVTAQKTDTDTDTDTSSLRSDVPRTTRAKAARIPPDFAPDIEEAQRIGLSPAEARTEAATFVDYWTAKGAGGAKLDWPATWRVWCRNTIKRRPTGPPSRQQRAVNGYAALALEMAANEPDRPNRPDQASGPGHRPQQGDAYPRLLDAEQPRRAG